MVFSLSYSVLPDPAPLLAKTWAALGPGGRQFSACADVGKAPGPMGLARRPIGHCYLVASLLIGWPIPLIAALIVRPRNATTASS
jgi:hypothetical protein